MWHKILIKNCFAKTNNPKIVLNHSAHFILGAEQNKVWMNNINQYRTS